MRTPHLGHLPVFPSALPRTRSFEPHDPHVTTTPADSLMMLLISSKPPASSHDTTGTNRTTVNASQHSPRYLPPSRHKLLILRNKDKWPAPGSSSSRSTSWTHSSHPSPAGPGDAPRR